MKRCKKPILITLSFWGLVLFGPVLLRLWNALSPAQYHPGDLGYVVFIVLSQGISCALAYYAANHISEGLHQYAVVVNGVVACTLQAILIIFALIQKVPTGNMISGIISFVVLIIGAVSSIKKVEKDVE